MSAAHAHGAAGLTSRTKPRWEIADILRLHGEDYRRSHPVPLVHLKIMRALSACRTPVLGGHVEHCDNCGFERQAYNSCRNRHCPKCQSLAKAKWLKARAVELLPVGYFHVVFTLPHELNPLILCNKATVLTALFDGVAQTLSQFGRDPRNGLGGKIGFLCVLHTWDQKLLDHFHLHCLIPAGALSPDGRRWIAARKDFLFPVKALAKVFRGKFVAISNHRIQAVEDGNVTFAYRDRRDGDAVKAMTVPGTEFVRRFLLHALPPSFMRIRHFGFLANRSKGCDLQRCRELLGLSPEPPEEEPLTTQEQLRELTGKDPAQCPACKTGVLKVIAELPKLPMDVWPHFPFPLPRFDSS